MYAAPLSPAPAVVDVRSCEGGEMLEYGFKIDYTWCFGFAEKPQLSTRQQLPFT